MDTFVNTKYKIKYSNRKCNMEYLRNEMLIDPIAPIFRTNEERKIVRRIVKLLGEEIVFSSSKWRISLPVKEGYPCVIRIFVLTRK